MVKAVQALQTSQRLPTQVIVSHCRGVVKAVQALQTSQRLPKGGRKYLDKRVLAALRYSKVDESPPYCRARTGYRRTWAPLSMPPLNQLPLGQTLRTWCYTSGGWLDRSFGNALKANLGLDYRL
eukprot:5635240-Amphidinium_carterae.1